MENDNVNQEVEGLEDLIENESEYTSEEQVDSLVADGDDAEYPIIGDDNSKDQIDKCKEEQIEDKQDYIQEGKDEHQEGRDQQNQDQQEEEKQNQDQNEEHQELHDEGKEENQEEILQDKQQEILQENQEECLKERLKVIQKEDGLVNQEVNQQEKKTENKFLKKHKKIIIVTIIVLVTLITFYFEMAMYFMNHFYFNTKVNGIDVSWESVKNAEILMSSKLNLYTITLKERDGKQEQIKATDIDMRYNSNNELNKLLEKQNPFGWILACLHSKDYNLTIGVTYDDKLLEEDVDNLSCFNSNNIIEPENPRLVYEDNTYKIIEGNPGNKVHKEVLYSHLSEALLDKEDEVDLERIMCYLKPKYNLQSQEIIEAKDKLNKYISANITYTFGNDKEIIDKSTINKWLLIDDDYNVDIDENKVEEYIDELCEKYNTAGRVRNFITTSGNKVQIENGDYTDSINKTIETENVISAIEDGRTVEMEPLYCDIGNTYVEINLTKQHLWFYKDSKLIIDGDVVTGNLSTNHETPPGVYSLKWKAKDAILRGPDYACPVAFWMPFYDGMGIHDATWRYYFGGEIYKTNGSHGCINCPYNLANVIYDNIEPGTPIVCYYYDSTNSETN